MIVWLPVPAVAGLKFVPFTPVPVSVPVWPGVATGLIVIAAGDASIQISGCMFTDTIGNS
ncbi:hypothetical protein D3C86_1195520 [compost metagenome]